MSFPSTEIINTWFQNAHTTAVAAGGSVYVMEKRAEQEVVKDVLTWACQTMLHELEELNYPTNSRVSVRVTEMLDNLCTADDVDDTEDEEEFVDDYNNDEDEEDETTKESEIDLNTCEIGQKLKLRDGKIVRYEGPSILSTFPHKASGSHYTHKGEYYADGEKSRWDIVEILPLEDETTSEEPSIVVDTDLAIEIVGALLKAITSM